MNQARRGFLACLLAAAARTAGAAPQRLRTIAIVFNSVPVSEMTTIPPRNLSARAIVDGLAEKGWKHGKTVNLVWRSAERHPERFTSIMEDLTRMPADVIVVSGNTMAHAARAATSTIPIVMANSTLAMEDGLVTSYARSGGNITGLSNSVGLLNGKRIALLKELSPGLTRVALLTRRSDTSLHPDTEGTLKRLGLTGFMVHAERREEYANAFAEAVGKGANGIVALATPALYIAENQVAIQELAVQHRLPVVYGVLNAVASGGLAAFGTNEHALYWRAAAYVDRILKGANPADLPVEQPGEFYLHVNRGAAAAIGLTLPRSILMQAHRVLD